MKHFGKKAVGLVLLAGITLGLGGCHISYEHTTVCGSAADRQKVAKAFESASQMSSDGLIRGKEYNRIKKALIASIARESDESGDLSEKEAEELLSDTRDLRANLTSYKRMHESGDIDDAEYEQLRKQLIEKFCQAKG
jgi:hypothetical protein